MLGSFAMRSLGVWLLACSACSSVVAVPPEPPAPPGPPGTIDFAREGFESRGTRARVRIFERGGGDVVRIGAEARLPASPEEVQEVLLDYPRHPGTVSHVAEARPLERGDGWMLVYQRLSMPVIDDRDFVLRVTWGEHADGSRWIVYRAGGEGPPPVDGVVRVTQNHGGWYLRPIESGRATLARYESNMDLGGSLPTWMSRSGAVDELPDLFTGVCELLGLPRDACPSS